VPFSPETWIETPLPQPVPLLAGHTYRLSAFGDGVVTHYARFDGLPTFAHGTLDQSFQCPGDGFPTEVHPAQWWFIDLVYQVKSPQPLAVSPTVTATFAAGVWSGSLTVAPEATQVALRAQTTAATASVSGLFNVIAFVDTDHDGIPDDWELAHGLNPNNGADALEDLDDDGMTNLAEYQAGTDPQDPASALRIVEVAAEPDGIHLQFLAAANKSYTVLAAETPLAAVWTTVSHVDAGLASRTVSVIDPSPSAPARFYKIVTPRR